VLLLDVNVVLAAHRDDHPHYEPVRTWFDAMRSDGERFTVPSLVWGSFLRLATNRRVFDVPTPRGEAFAFIDAMCAQPGFLAVGPGARHLALLQRLCDEADAAGDLIADAVIAAIAVEHGCEIVTLDRDFARFESVRHRRPLTA
jgi:toxin-antitoxin system PIN domain toxin